MITKRSRQAFPKLRWPRSTTARATCGIRGWYEESIHVRRNVTISVRFSEDEITMLRAKADVAAQPVTAYIRSAALQQVAPVDRGRLLKALRAASESVGHAEHLLSEQ